MLVLSSAVVLQAAAAAQPDLPLVGWHNVVTPQTIVATKALSGSNPASLLGTPNTFEQWWSDSTEEQYLTITTNEVDPIDYIGVAKHNFSSAEIPVSIEGFIDDEWVEIVEEVILADDSPVIFRFAAQSLSQVRIRLQEGSVEPRAAVVYCGRLLPLQRRIYVGHTPLPHGRRFSISNGMSESGQFLGSIITGEWRATTVPLSLLDPDWYRANLDPLLSTGHGRPFFFAWRPDSYPREVGYGWLTEDPAPVPASPSNLISVDLKITGVS